MMRIQSFCCIANDEYVFSSNCTSIIRLEIVISSPNTSPIMIANDFYNTRINRVGTKYRFHMSHRKVYYKDKEAIGLLILLLVVLML